MTMTPQEKARWSRIKRVYGITKEQFDGLDPGYCVICTRPWSSSVRPVVDHSHKTGEIRGVICAYCNHRIVGRHTDGALLVRLATYVTGPHTGWIVPPKKKKKKNAKRNRQTTD